MNLFQTAAAPEPLSMLTMLGGGLLAFVSPCVLPMLPVYAMYLMGSEKERGSWLMVLRRCIGLLFGFVLLFTLMGAGAGALGSLLKNADRGILNTVTGVLMIVFGLWMLDLFHLKTGMPGWMLYDLGRKVGVEICQIKECYPYMFVLTNTKGMFGAVAMTCDVELECFAKRIGKGFYILPSSVHEVILVPENKEFCVEYFASMVREINETQMDPTEILSDSIYFYDKETLTLRRVA